jgi:RNA polymerase sigma-70 factor (ECF subfamily)
MEAIARHMDTGGKIEKDEALLARIRKGEHAAFAELVNRHATRFYRVAYRYVQQREEAEDVVQDAFIKLWERPDMWQADKNTKFTTWFHRVVVNRCLDIAKRKTPLPLDPEFDIVDVSERQDDALAARERQRALEQAIRDLPDRQRMAVNLCFQEEHSNQEAAEIMGLHLKALQSLLMRAKATLKERMKAYGPLAH